MSVNGWNMATWAAAVAAGLVVVTGVNAIPQARGVVRPN